MTTTGLVTLLNTPNTAAIGTGRKMAVLCKLVYLESHTDNVQLSTGYRGLRISADIGRADNQIGVRVST